MRSVTPQLSNAADGPARVDQDSLLIPQPEAMSQPPTTRKVAARNQQMNGRIVRQSAPNAGTEESISSDDQDSVRTQMSRLISN